MRPIPKSVCLSLNLGRLLPYRLPEPRLDSLKPSALEVELLCPMV